MPQDHYRTLDVSPEASPEEIQRSYRALARRYHPDRNPLPAAAKLMAEINAAYGVLRQPARRAAYDRSKSKENPAVDNAVLAAARETLIRQSWTVVNDRFTEFVLKRGSKNLRVCLTRSLSQASLRQYVRQFSGFQVVLAIRIDPGLRNSDYGIAIIDLMHSELHAGSFPDPAYESLFQRFL